MRVSDLISTKIESLLGSNYKLFSISHFNRNYTEAREVRQGEDVGYVRTYTSDYGKFRKNKVVGVVTLTNPTRSNANIYYLNTNYKIEFSVPRNIEKVDKYGNLIEENAFNFDDDIDDLIESLINSTLQFSEDYKGKMTMSEPEYLLTESDGEYYYDIMRVSGSVVLSDAASFGSDYTIKLLVDDEYVELDGINTYSEILNSDGNAIVKQGKTKVEQNLAQLGWACTLSIDDFITDNKARLKLYEYIHLNKEILNPNASTNALKRKQRVKIVSPYNDEHLFDALVGISFETTLNGVGSYNISFTDDNKPIQEYILSFDSNGGSAVDPMTIKDYDEIGELPSATLENYDLDSWLIDGEKITNQSIYSYSEDKIAVASWLPAILIDMIGSASRKSVSFSCVDLDVVIHYTLDGTIPNENSSVATQGMVIMVQKIGTETITINAIGYKNGIAYTKLASVSF